MKKLGILAVMVLIFAGCSRDAKELDRAISFRGKLLQAQEVRFDAKITADYEEEVYLFAMKCSCDSKGEVFFSLTSPDSIAGISGSITDVGGKLTFNDTAVRFELMADEQLSPVCAPWILMKTLRSGYLTSVCQEEELFRLTIDDSYEEDALQLDIWLDAHNSPCRADILFDGKRILQLCVENFEIS